MQALMDDYLDTQQSACNFDTLDDVEDVYAKQSDARRQVV